MINFAKKKEVKIIPLKVKLPFVEKLTIVESLAIMLTAGIPILDALESIQEDSSNPKTKGVVSAIIDSIQKGSTLADSFSQFPNIFDGVLINTVRAGEESGSLDEVLKSVSDSLKQTEQLKSDVRQAMFYPAIVMAVLLFVLVVLMGFVVPRVADIFDKLNIPKPLPTKLLLYSASFVSQYYLFVLAALFLITVAAIYLFSVKALRRNLLTLLFRLPVFGNILKYLDLSRFSSTLSLLLSSGIPIIKAVRLAGSVVINQKTNREVEEISHKLTQGRGLADSMKEYKTFPTLMTSIINTGEKTGTLDQVLSEVASHYQTELARQIKTLSTVLEPVLIIVIGVIVGAVILAIISPIYQLIGQIQPR